MPVYYRIGWIDPGEKLLPLEFPNNMVKGKGYGFFPSLASAQTFVDKFYAADTQDELEEIVEQIAPVDACARPRNAAGYRVVAESVTIPLDNTLLADRPERLLAPFFVETLNLDPEWLAARRLERCGGEYYLPYPPEKKPSVEPERPAASGSADIRPFTSEKSKDWRRANSKPAQPKHE